MPDFYLHKYTAEESMHSGIVAPHKYRHQTIIRGGLQNTVLGAWKKDKEKIVSRYVNDMLKFYNKEDVFLVIVPASNTKVFTDDILEGVQKFFPNCRYIGECFTKKEDVSFGDARFKDHSIEELLNYINVNEEEIMKIDSPREKIFIIDDVYSSGKSIDLLIHLIRTHISPKSDIKSGVILTT
ncbi:MAG: hypothetical protein AB7O73_05735 [Bacteroidia bacterium]